jgi:hypothetical protein
MWSFGVKGSPKKRSKPSAKLGRMAAPSKLKHYSASARAILARVAFVVTGDSKAIYNRLHFGQDFGLMKRAHAVKTLSLPHEVLRKGMERAGLFRMKFSHYIGLLIERDYASGTRKIVIVASLAPK